MQEHELPTYTEIEKHALEHLDAAWSEMSQVRDWLRSDWRPTAGPPLYPDGVTQIAEHVPVSPGRL
jgi:hypothetical protein